MDIQDCEAAVPIIASQQVVDGGRVSSEGTLLAATQLCSTLPSRQIPGFTSPQHLLMASPTLFCFPRAQRSLTDGHILGFGGAIQRLVAGVLERVFTTGLKQTGSRGDHREMIDIILVIDSFTSEGR
ncbi:hypothetical protein BDN67DRAFT_90034 [Paxillus ammoniavirescens]|nr:hypothetical protein BDN67DRAFT_90034 [Paxillus ammoniavirescens]